MKNTVRTFVAVEIGAEIRSRAGELIEQLRDTPANVKWVDPANMHLTLKFLGEIPTAEIPRICKAVGEATAPVAPFPMEVRGAGAFPTVRRPRTVWLGTEAGGEDLVSLHGRIETALAELGFRTEHRRFQPHLTIGRVRRSPIGIDDLGQRLDGAADYTAGRTQVTEVVVFSSRLDRAGPTYEPLGRIRLGGK
ncbi:MAG: RNA 2',3'-cyclic phosphodiesterase [Planctomycetes bacterium]|nr:RNA 2',3'-cyclic phosphodiesterase [Planctomycetota bacterium]